MESVRSKSWIERRISGALSNSPLIELAETPAYYPLARLVAMKLLSMEKGLSHDKAKQAKLSFNNELEDFVAGKVTHPPPDWLQEGNDPITRHYGRIMVLTTALMLHSNDEISNRIAEAFRDETNALCHAYFDHMDRMLERLR